MAKKNLWILKSKKNGSLVAANNILMKDDFCPIFFTKKAAKTFLQNANPANGDKRSDAEIVQIHIVEKYK